MSVIDTLPFVIPPYPDQLQELREHYNDEYRAIFWDPGTGKSKLVIDNMVALYLEGKISAALIFAKAGEYANWVDKHLPEHWPPEIPMHAELFTSQASNTRMREQLQRFMANDTKFQIFVVNVESMRIGKKVSDQSKGFTSVEWWARRITKGGEKIMLVVDESTCIKHYKSAKHKAVLYCSRILCSYRRIMSGTPTTENPLDLWGQAEVLKHQGSLLGTTNFVSYRSEYTNPKTVFLGQRVLQTYSGYRNVDKLKAIMKPWATFKNLDEVVTIPSVSTTTTITLTDEQRKYLAQLYEQAYLEFVDVGFVELTNALAWVNKAYQIILGHLILDNGETISIPSNRPAVLIEKLEELGPRSAIIWTHYRYAVTDVARQIGEAFGHDKVGTYFGGTSTDDRRNNIRALHEGQIRYLVANQRVGGYGSDFTAANYNFYYSNAYSGEQRLQSEARTRRIGQTRTVYYNDFIVPDTIDERAYKIAIGKRDYATAFKFENLTEPALLLEVLKPTW